MTANQRNCCDESTREGEMACEPMMPADWDDHAGWEDYYRALPASEYGYRHHANSLGSLGGNLGSFIDASRRTGRMRVWVPGCGISPIPRMLAAFGFTVYATDVSANAIAYQRSGALADPSIIDAVRCESERQEGTVIAEVHDFRQPLGVEPVDVILNMKAFQGLPPASKELAARSHFQAMVPGGLAVFDTMNVQGTLRDEIEDTLAEAGFYVPLRMLDRWYRARLAETGIAYAFCLGRPLIAPGTGYPHPHGSDEYQRDREILRAITAEYEARMRPEYERERAEVGEQPTLARVVYSTG